MKLSSNIIILGAKPIKGMRSLGALSNIEIHNKKNILDIQLYNLKKRFLLDNIIYVGGYMSEKMDFSKKYRHIRYVHNESYLTKNNGHSLGLAAPYLKYDNSLIIFSKTLFSYKIFDWKKNNSSCVFIDRCSSNAYKIGCNIDSETNRINNLFYGLGNRLCGVYFLQKNETDLLRTILSNKCNLANNFIFEIINDIIDLGGNFKPISLDKKLVYQIDSAPSLKKTIKTYVKNFST